MNYRCSSDVEDKTVKVKNFDHVKKQTKKKQGDVTKPCFPS